MHLPRPAIALLLLLAPNVHAQPLALSFNPTAAATAGRSTAVDLIALNPGDVDASLSPPSTLAARLMVDSRSWPVELRARADGLDPHLAVAPHGFATFRYTFTSPPRAIGTAILEARLPDGTVIHGVLDLAPAAAARSADPARPPTQKPPLNLVRAEPAASVIQRTFAQRLAPHEPIYFIYGPDAPGAKFQFSFKYRLLQFTELTSQSRSRTLQFAFTQRSLWDLTAESSPFYDTSYMPEIFLESLAPRPEDRDTWFTWLGYQAGFKHESNGRDGAVSRSLNLLQFRTAFSFGDLEGWHLLVVPEVWAYVAGLGDNPDLKDYRGYGDLRLVLGRNDGPSLMATLWAGRDLQHRSMQLDLTLPVRTKLLDFETYLLIQYFNGYGESLLHYNESSESVRAGISLVR